MDRDLPDSNRAPDSVPRGPRMRRHIARLSSVAVQVGRTRPPASRRVAGLKSEGAGHEQ